MKRVFAAVVLFGLQHSSAWAGTDCEASKADYNSLKIGMSYAEAVEILGCDGEEMSSSELAGYKTIMLMWDGSSLGANMNAMFQNNKLIQKAQFGLR